MKIILRKIVNQKKAWAIRNLLVPENRYNIEITKGVLANLDPNLAFLSEEGNLSESSTIAHAIKNNHFAAVAVLLGRARSLNEIIPYFRYLENRSESQDILELSRESLKHFAGDDYVPFALKSLYLDATEQALFLSGKYIPMTAELKDKIIAIFGDHLKRSKKSIEQTGSGTEVEDKVKIIIEKDARALLNLLNYLPTALPELVEIGMSHFLINEVVKHPNRDLYMYNDGQNNWISPTIIGNTNIIVTAIRNGNEAIANIAIEHAGNNNYFYVRDKHGDNAITLAAKKNYKVLLQKILAKVKSKGALIANNDNENPIFEAIAASCDLDILVLLLSVASLEDLELKSKKTGMNVFHKAAELDLRSHMNLLLAVLGSKPLDHLDERGNTGFHYIARKNSPEMAKLILNQIDKSSSTNSLPLNYQILEKRNSAGFTPLMELIRYHDANSSRSLLDFFINMYSEESLYVNGQSNVLIACIKKKDVISSISIIEKTDNRDNLLYTDEAKATALHYAIINKMPSIAEALINKCTKQYALFMPDNSGRSVLHYAYENGESSTFDKLMSIARQDFIHSQDSNGNTIMMKMTINGDLVSVGKLLIGTDNKEFLLLKNNKSETVYDIAINAGQIQIAVMIEQRVQALIKVEQDLEAARLKEQKDREEAERKAREEETKDLQRDEKSNIALKRRLLTACGKGDLAEIKEIVALEPDFGIKFTDNHNNGPMFYAVFGGQIDSILELYAQGLHPDIENNAGYTPFMIAAATGKVEAMKALLLAEADPKYKSYRDKNTAFIHAAEKGKIESLDLILKIDSRDTIQEHIENFKPVIQINEHLTSKNIDDEDALMMAISNGHVECAEWLIEKGASLTTRDKFGNTLLMKAAQYNRLEAVQLIYKLAGENADKLLKEVNYDGEDALFVSARYNSHAITRFLVDAGSHIDRVSFAGISNFEIAATYGSEESLKVILETGALYDSQNRAGATPLMLALKNGWINCATLLIEKGASISTRDKLNLTPLLYAAHSGHPDVVEYALRQGASLEEVDKYGANALLYAAKFDFTALANKLIDLGIKVDCTDQARKTPLMHAIHNMRHYVADELINRGANIGLRDVNGWSALHYACLCGNVKYFSHLVSLGQSIDDKINNGAQPIHIAAQHENIELVQFLLTNGVDPNAKGGLGWSPLMYAAAFNCPEVVEILLAAKANIEFKSDAKSTAFIEAAEAGHIEVLKTLLQNGANMNALSEWGTALISAIRKQKNEIVDYLLKIGVNTNLPDNNGYTPLIVAARFGDSELVKTLIKAGAKVNEVDSIGRTPLMFAMLGRSKEVVDILLAVGASPEVKTTDGTSLITYAESANMAEYVAELTKRKPRFAVGDSHKIFGLELSDDGERFIATGFASKERMDSCLANALIAAINQKDISGVYVALESGVNPLAPAFADYVTPFGLALHTQNMGAVKLIRDSLSKKYTPEQIDELAQKSLNGINGYYQILAHSIANTCSNDPVTRIELTKTLAARLEKGEFVNAEIRKMLCVKADNYEYSSRRDHFDMELKLNVEMVNAIKRYGIDARFPEIDRTLVSEDEVQQIMQELIIMIMLQQKPSLSLESDLLNKVHVDVELSESLHDTLTGAVLTETDRFMKDYVHNSIYVPREERIKRNSSWREKLNVDYSDQPRLHPDPWVNMNQLTYVYKKWGGIALDEVDGVKPLENFALSRRDMLINKIKSLTESCNCLYNAGAKVEYSGNTIEVREGVRVMAHGTAVYEDGRQEKYESFDWLSAQNLSQVFNDIPIPEVAKQFALLKAIYTMIPVAQVMVATHSIPDFKDYKKPDFYETEKMQLPVFVRLPQFPNGTSPSVNECETKYKDSWDAGAMHNLNMSVFGGTAYKGGFDPKEHPGNWQRDSNGYGGEDRWRIVTFKAGTRIVGNSADGLGPSAFFSSESTLMKSTGNAPDYFQSLQVGKSGPPHSAYRGSLNIYEFKEETTCYVALCRANTMTSGDGGAIQAYIYNHADALRFIGVKINLGDADDRARG